MDVQELKDHLEFDVFGHIHPLTEKGERYLVEHPELSSSESVKKRVDLIELLIKGFESELGKASSYKEMEKAGYFDYVIVIYNSFINIFHYLDEKKEKDVDTRLFVNNIVEKFDQFIYNKGEFYEEEKALIDLFYKKYISGDTGLDTSQVYPLVKKLYELYKANENKEDGYLDSVKINNYYSLHNLEINDLKSRKEIYFLGENGDGKTILLQAILLGLKKQYLRFKGTDKERIGKLLQVIDENESLRIFAVDANKKFYGRSGSYHKNIFAYGVHRSQTGSARYVDKEGYLTLFSKDRKLLDPIEWLKDVKLEEGRSVLSLDIAKSILEELLDNNVKINLVGSQVNFTDLRFTERTTGDLRFEQLSEGYQSVMIWVADLLSRLLKNQPNAKKIEDLKGIVLVDEIGLHLHPKWEANLVKTLRKWFPKIQFFFTTHSPVMILSASEDAVFYRVYKEDGVTKISEPFYSSELSDLMINSIITSPLFGFDTVHMKSFNPDKDELDTAFEGYLAGRIRRMVEAETKKLKEEGKVYLSPDLIDDLIVKALDKYQSEK